jgi:TatD DNase family protein
VSNFQAQVKFHDAHNHFQDEWLVEHRPRLLEQLQGIGLTRAVVNGTTESDWAEVAKLAGAHGWILPSYGLHPWHCGGRSDQWLVALRHRLASQPAAQVGEIGLDRWILNRARPDDPRRLGAKPGDFDQQIEVFVAQLRLAAELNRAATIHCLDAFGKLLELLQAETLPQRGVLLHAYGGPPEMVEAFLERGCYFSFNGAFLAPRAAAKREAFARVPDDRLLVETDAPAMPLPPRHRRYPLPDTSNGTAVNNPAEIRTVYEELARLRGVTLEKLSELVGRNFELLFGQHP